MRRLIEFLFEHPYLLAIVVLWIVGAIGNIGKAARRTRQQQPPVESMPPPDAVVFDPPAAPSPARTRPQPEPRGRAQQEAEVRREMLEILGQRERTQGDERAPTPVVTPTTSTRRLPTHVDPHVGEAMARRSQAQRSKVGVHAPGTELGSLGGRAATHGPTRVTGGRYPLTELRRVIVLNEILGPPLSLRQPRES